MKAPDKIYVARYNGESFSHSWTIEPLGDTTATEYIRKDGPSAGRRSVDIDIMPRLVDDISADPGSGRKLLGG